MPLTSGARLGPYEVIGPLGKGGMGEVYRARDSRLGREVAIKVLPEHTAGSPDALARFEFEARAVAALNHPNIVALHDVGIASGVSYAVSELLDGSTLRQRLRRDGALTPAQALDFAVQFARGLAAAHGRGIIHRDLKPENLFITSDGRVKILDFGIALHDLSSASAAAAETRFATESGLLVGTLAYMAPEQVRGEPASFRSDVFSFGLVVYEMLTGTNPFHHETAAEISAAILRDRPAALMTVSGLPFVGARIVERCLEKNADDRPESMRDIAVFLEAATGDTGVTPPPAALTPAAVRRLATRVIAVTCAAIVLLTLLMWGYVRSSTNRATAAAVAADLARADALVGRTQKERLDRLQLSARLVASFPGLKALFETDAPTIRDFLQTYLQRNPGLPMLIALGPDGTVLARTDTVAAAEKGQTWLSALIALGGAGLIAIDGRPYHTALQPAEAGGTIFGTVIAAAPLDNTFAQLLRDATEDEVVLLTKDGVAGTSLRAGRAPWRSLEEYRTQSGSNGTLDGITIGAARFSAREVMLTKDPPTAAVILVSRDELAAPYRGMQNGLLAIGAALAVIAGAGGLLALRRYSSRHRHP
jgi:hypothetical protein